MNPAPKKPDETTYSGRFAARLRMLREKRGLTVQQVAEAIREAGNKLTDRTYYSWEAGQYTPPFETLPAIADALSVKTVGGLFPAK